MASRSSTASRCGTDHVQLQRDAEAGERRHRAQAPGAVDRQLLQTKMKDTIERAKATDPNLLRRRSWSSRRSCEGSEGRDGGEGEAGRGAGPEGRPDEAHRGGDREAGPYPGSDGSGAAGGRRRGGCPSAGARAFTCSWLRRVSSRIAPRPQPARVRPHHGVRGDGEQPDDGMAKANGHLARGPPSTSRPASPASS